MQEKTAHFGANPNFTWRLLTTTPLLSKKMIGFDQ